MTKTCNEAEDTCERQLIDRRDADLTSIALTFLGITALLRSNAVGTR